MKTICDKIDVIYSILDLLIRNKHFNAVDTILNKLDISTLGEDDLLAILHVSRSAKSHLTSYVSFYLKALDKLGADNMPIGLG